MLTFAPAKVYRMTIQYVLEIIGTFAFAISGALSPEGKYQDWLGATFTGFITAIGGGTLRDVLLGSYPLVWISDINILFTIFIAIIFTYALYPYLLRLKKTLLLFDTFGIALFTLVGTEKALQLDVPAVIAVIMGVFSAVMGGVIRDTITNETPVLFRKEIYASACLAGATAYVLLDDTALNRDVNFILGVLTIVGIRLAAIRFKLALPQYNRE